MIHAIALDAFKQHLSLVIGHPDTDRCAGCRQPFSTQPGPALKDSSGQGGGPQLGCENKCPTIVGMI
jgi:hypothetical protein